MSSIDPVQRLGYGDILREHRRSRGGRVAVVEHDVRLTWADLDNRVNRLSSVLGAAGVGTDGPLLWLGQNSFRLLECLLAAAKLGAAFCPANWRMSAGEMAFVVDDLGPSVVVWQGDEIGDAVRAARKVTSTGATWIQHDDDGPEGYEPRVAGASQEDPGIDVDPALPLLVVYTAAFDGHPNGAVLSHVALVVQNLVMGRLLDIDDTTVYLNGGPLFHIGTFMGTNATFHHGGTNVMNRRSDAAEICRLIESERCTHGFVAGPTVDAIVANDGFGADLSSMWPDVASIDRRNPVVAPPSSPWHGRGGTYGQSEVVGIAAFKAIGGPSAGTSGRPSGACAMRIVRPDGSDTDAGEVGEILVRGPLVMVGYHRRPDLNGQRHRDGWHHTRDLGRREPDGSISFIGPALSMIKSAHENVYPAEVEACIRAHAGVADVCVIGIPDPTWTQSVKAVVVARDGAVLTPDDIIEHCRERIASYKKPRVVELVAALPKGATGLVDREAVDAAHGGGGYPGVGA